MYESKELRQGGVQFDYFADNYAQFKEDYYRYSTLSVPLIFLTDDLLQRMMTSQQNFFVLDRAHATDGRDHTFYFRVKTVERGKRVRVYQYVGMNK